MEELKWTEAKLWVPLVREEMAGGGRSTADRDAAAEALVSGGAPVVDDQQEVVGKMREGEAELVTGSAWAEGLQRGGSMVSLCSPAFKWTAAVFWGLGTGKQQKNEGNSSLGFL